MGELSLDADFFLIWRKVYCKNKQNKKILRGETWCDVSLKNNIIKHNDKTLAKTENKATLFAAKCHRSNLGARNILPFTLLFTSSSHTAVLTQMAAEAQGACDLA